MKQKFLKIAGAILLLGVWISYVIYNNNDLKMQDLKYAKKAETAARNLNELRIALEKYYLETGDYPDLTREEVWNNLSLLDFTNEKGETISFAQIYGKNALAKTPDLETEGSGSNRVYSVKNFNEVTFDGGWNYNYEDKTGEIRINLPKGVFHQGIEWCKH
jgi:hypothetical protein